MKKILTCSILCLTLSACNSGGSQNSSKNLSQQKISGNSLGLNSILDLCVLNKTNSDITLSGSDKSYMFMGYESVVFRKISAAEQSLNNQVIKPNNIPQCITVILPKVNFVNDDKRSNSFVETPFSVSVKRNLYPISFSPYILLFGKRGDLLPPDANYNAAYYNNIEDITYKGQDMTVVLKSSSGKAINIVVID